MARSYQQFCAVARALDVLGERWTLLLVRDLMLGPRRYGELLDSLPMGTNLLAARLRDLTAAGICASDGGRYALTPRGEELRDVVLALARWEMTAMGPPAGDDRLRGDWYAVAMLAAYRRPSGRPRREAYEFEVGGQPFHLVVGGAQPVARRGAAERPAFRLAADVSTFLGIATRGRPPSEATISGDRRAVGRWLATFSLPAPVAA